MSDEIMNPRQAAHFLGISVWTLRAWRHSSRGPAFIRYGRAVRYRRSALERFLRTKTIGGK